MMNYYSNNHENFAVNNNLRFDNTRFGLVENVDCYLESNFRGCSVVNYYSSTAQNFSLSEQNYYYLSSPVSNFYGGNENKSRNSNCPSFHYEICMYFFISSF